MEPHRGGHHTLRDVADTNCSKRERILNKKSQKKWLEQTPKHRLVCDYASESKGDKGKGDTHA